jgi:hypothetical protein
LKIPEGKNKKNQLILNIKRSFNKEDYSGLILVLLRERIEE